MKPFLLGIAGPSCAGKTSLCLMLKELLGDALIVSLDNYWRDPQTFDRIGEWRNWELPKNLKLDELRANLSDLRLGLQTPAPQWHMAPGGGHATTVVLTPAPVILAEGFLLFSDEAVRELFDLRIYVDIPDELVVARRVARARTGYPNTWYYREVVVPEYRKYGLPSKADCHLVLDGTRPLQENAQRILREIRRMR